VWSTSTSIPGDEMCLIQTTLKVNIYWIKIEVSYLSETKVLETHREYWKGRVIVTCYVLSDNLYKQISVTFHEKE
jgi:hypothetical protein